VANPTALILSAALMLRHLGETDAAERVEGAVRDVIGEGESVPRDLGGTAGTRAFGAAVADRVSSLVAVP
jgi:isocitrate dehydrogenase (NAD+)